jgi:HTH-type transcriptional regulator / antitoxin MqsA
MDKRTPHYDVGLVPAEVVRCGAARLTGGGHNAFSRYERGEAVPLPAVVNLFRLLDKHPELLKDLA